MNWVLTPDKFLTGDEVQNLRKICKDAADLAKSKGRLNAIRAWMIIDMALQAGLRVGEISNLEFKDLFIEKGHSHIHVRQGKGNKSRLITIGESLRKHLRQYLKERNSQSPHLFTSERSEFMTTSAIQKDTDKDKVYKLIQEFSHGLDPVSAIEHKDESEIKSAIVVMMKMIEESDKKHFESLKSVLN